MISYIQSKEIKPGQFTEHDGYIFVAVAKSKRMPCRYQCDCKARLASEDSMRCSGYCYRFTNFNDIVFKKVKTIESVGEDEEITLVETQFGKACREFAQQLAEERLKKINDERV